MALCLAPTLEFANGDDATQFLALIHEIYQFTYQNEEQCSAYCWFRNITDPRSVQGFEFYDNEDALAVTHRESAPYKKMRRFISGLQEADSTLLKFPPLLLLTPVEGFVDNDDALRFEDKACKFRVTTIKLYTNGELSSSTAAQFTACLKRLAQDLDRTGTGLACHTAAAASEQSTSGISTTLHFLFVECYSSEQDYLAQQDQNYLCLVKLVHKFKASITVTDCAEGFGFMRSKRY